MAPIDNLKNSKSDGEKYKVTTSAQTATGSSFKDEVIGKIYDKIEPEKIPETLLKGVSDFLDGKKPDSSDIPYSKVYIQTKVAKEFGDAKDFSEWVKGLDKILEVQSFYAIKAIKEKAKEGKYDWDSIVAAMHNADGLAMVQDSHKKVYDTWAADNTNWFKFDGSADADKVRQIQAWFKKAICDTDPTVSDCFFNCLATHVCSIPMITSLTFVLVSIYVALSKTYIDCSTLPQIYENSVIVSEGVVTRLAKIAAKTGASVDNFQHFWANKESQKDKVLEIGLIRFPDKEDPLVKLYRIQIFAWFNSARVLMVQHDQAGFDLEFDVMKFKAVDAVVEAITATQLEKVSAKLNDPSTFDF
jgi:hypothetical protein